MTLIAGLGNPGAQYASTRHNFGFWVMDDMAGKLGLAFGPGKGDYLYAQGPPSPVLIKPTSYMNDSGLPLKEALAFFAMTPEEALVVLDDIDLPLGTLRFRSGGGAGTHRGLESVLFQLATEQVPRLRLGIATDATLRPSEDYVLSPFRSADADLVQETRQKAVQALNYFLDHGIELAMTRFNVRDRSADSGKAILNESD